MARVIISADAEAYHGGQVPLEEVRITLEGAELYAAGESGDAEQVGVLTDVSVRLAGQPTDRAPKPFSAWPNPDHVGTSEYRAIHETCEDADDPDQLAAILAEFIDTASALLGGGLTPAAASEAPVDGSTSAWIDCPDCSYRAIDDEDLAEHQELNHPSPTAGRGKPVRIMLTPDDLADLQDGASITTLTDDGQEVSLGPEGSAADGWLIPAHLTDLAAGLSVEVVSGHSVALTIEPPSGT